MENHEELKLIGINLIDIAEEISQLVKTDQDIRVRMLEDPKSWDDSVDKHNTVRMKQIIKKIGWPTISKVGEMSSHNAWLLVQHADHDIEFQKYCLALMKNELSGEIVPRDIAYLEDRVKVNTNQPQAYGTQFTNIDGVFTPREIEDLDHIDERRKEKGLGTLAEGTEEMNLIYKTKKSK